MNYYFGFLLILLVLFLVFFNAFVLYKMLGRADYLKSRMGDNFYGFSSNCGSTFSRDLIVSSRLEVDFCVMSGSCRYYVAHVRNTNGLAKVLYVAVEIPDSGNVEGLYGGFMMRLRLNKQKITFRSFSKSDFYNFSVSDKLVRTAEFIEVCDGRAFLFVREGMFFGCAGVNLLKSEIKC